MAEDIYLKVPKISVEKMRSKLELAIETKDIDPDLIFEAIVLKEAKERILEEMDPEDDKTISLNLNCNKLDELIIAAKKAYGPLDVDDLSDLIHSIFCRSNHIDQCDYHYGSHKTTKYWRVADRLMEFAPLPVLTEIFKIMKEEKL